MAKVIDACNDLFEAYKTWVAGNPQTLGDLETTIKWASYFISGRISNSPVVSELTYSLSNLLVLFNDQIIAKSLAAATTPPPSRTAKQSNCSARLKLFLTTLEYCEVFIELSAQHLWGDAGKWFFVFVVQCVKCIFRALLTYRYGEEMVQIPATKSINRRELSKLSAAQAAGTGAAGADDDEQTNTFGANLSATFELRRSGRIVRRVEGAPPVHCRSWKAPSPGNGSLIDERLRRPKGKRLTVAEAVYIFKPIVHLGSVASFGLHSWKSYCVALAMDAFSLRAYYKNRAALSREQQIELSRRQFQMLLYLMRSPFFERHTRAKVTALVDGIARTIPMTKPLCSALNDYIPHWQSTYFYMWSS